MKLISIKSAKVFLAALTLLFGFVACEKTDDTGFDTEPPALDVVAPAPCEVILFGEKLQLKATFTDNEAVKSYKLNVHHNFDHHTHGDHQEVCGLDEIKIASNPYLNNWTVSLPNLPSISIDTTFDLPAGYEGGDYHVLLYLTDINGNQSWTGISVKMQ